MESSSYRSWPESGSFLEKKRF
uniref:Uncharacterized protein n=1 Tax=Arundo donax TaxID=35708 RepID=A0A0A9BG30_ARUDO